LRALPLRDGILPRALAERREAAFTARFFVLFFAFFALGRFAAAFLAGFAAAFGFGADGGAAFGFGAACAGVIRMLVATGGAGGGDGTATGVAGTAVLERPDSVGCG
jgi:hypothetical protein